MNGGEMKKKKNEPSETSIFNVCLNTTYRKWALPCFQQLMSLWGHSSLYFFSWNLLFPCSRLYVFALRSTAREDEFDDKNILQGS